MDDTTALFDLLRECTDHAFADALRETVKGAEDRKLNNVNPLAFASSAGLNTEATISGFLHATRLGIFDLSWNVLCPGCGGVLDANTSLRTVESEAYTCALCAAGYEPTLDEMVEVTFTVSPRIRRIAAHNPHQLPPLEYFRQIYWGSGIDLPEDNYEALVDEFVLEALELPAGEKAVISLQLPEAFIIVFEPVTHAAQFIDVKGEPTRERQSLTLVIDRGHRHHETLVMRPGPVRISIENQIDVRAVPSVCLANDALHDVLGKRRPFLTAKRILSNQTFRNIYHTGTLDVDQRLKVTSLTFLFTDLRGSTALYDKVGDLAAYDLVRVHFGVLTQIVAEEGGAVVKTIGDAVMATFPLPQQALSAAIRMRRGIDELNSRNENSNLVLKIGIHEGPCIAVSMNDRQDYFGQAVNIASRVQNLATPNNIFATNNVITAAKDIIVRSGLQASPHASALRGIDKPIEIYAIS
ncbi:adenylate/guanylate cyclase domain-containing protein [Nitratireductor mangrovi]|uniref:Adenylate/guanylate cyclase domain-containing protein n=1 Tax=Nitratireductor mangrovi TaxID=2599600 RepID=A0A5B8L5B5_9HYPH|nr:adenylate/guanylate cyclase domain-containing protein [Nitratireductor mangrovi]QDZ03127.1 adenylate/guanylate cyclase domain-containing protein [Nitratireductor mangrovi]